MKMQTEGGYDCATCGEPLNIIGVVTHDCDQILDASVLSRKERNTLLYVETRMVDHTGELDLEQMNHEDHGNLKLFHAAGIIEVRDSMFEGPHDTKQVVKFTDAAWDLARDSRQMRAASCIEREEELEVDLGDV